MSKLNYSVLSSVYYKDKACYLRQSINSILNQTLPTDDYIIVKDGILTPELDAVLNEFSNKHSKIRILELDKNQGLGNALNIGLAYCKNDLVARMDSDDISMSDRCEMQVEEFIKEEELDIVGTFLYEFYDDPNHIISLKKMPETNEEIFYYGKRRNPFNHPTVMYRKSTVLECGGYQTGKRGEDFALFTKMIYMGAKGKNIALPLLKYRTVDNQFKRRTSWTDTKAVLDVIKQNYEMGYSDITDILYSCFIQIGGFVCPDFLGKLLYRYVFRTKM